MQNNTYAPKKFKLAKVGGSALQHAFTLQVDYASVVKDGNMCNK
jgi:hypothetical protein